MIELKSTPNKTLNILLKDTNKALSKVLEEISPQELAKLSKTPKDLGELLTSFLKNSPNTNNQENQALLTLLKNNPTLKELSNVLATLKEFQKVLNDIKEPLPQTAKLQKTLQTLLENIKQIEPKELQNRLSNSGVFLESKLKNFTSPKTDLKNMLQELSTTLQSSKIPAVKELIPRFTQLLSSELFSQQTNKQESLTQFQTLTKELSKILQPLQNSMNSKLEQTLHPKDVLFQAQTKEMVVKINQFNEPHKLQTSQKIEELFSNDIKVQLAQAKEELLSTNTPQKPLLIQHIDKLNLQIDYYQLLSHLSNASALYLPYSFEGFEEGSISIKKAKKSHYFCDIDLKLKEYGQLQMRLGLFEKNQLRININCESKALREMLQNNLSQLKEQLFGVGIYPQDISFLDTHTTQYNENDADINLGFEVKA